MVVLQEKLHLEIKAILQIIRQQQPSVMGWAC